jgi:hypothetical protein
MRAYIHNLKKYDPLFSFSRNIDICNKIRNETDMAMWLRIVWVLQCEIKALDGKKYLKLKNNS